MKEFTESFILGKFYPPHKGHQYLIDEALKRSEHLTVLVMGTKFDTISVDTRADILRSIHRDANLTVTSVLDHIYDDYESEVIWKAHDALIKNSITVMPDAVFTSENYGDELASNLGAKHVCVDADRTTYPISATEIRADVYGNWDYLPKETQDFFRLKVAVMGGESTGTTTLSLGLFDHYRNKGGIFTSTEYVPEWGREYTEIRIENEGTRDLPWEEKHFAEIAEGQDKIYTDAFVSSVSPVIISDTDTLATEAFAPYFGLNSETSNYGLYDADRSNVIYFITDHTDMPLVDDGSRLEDIAARNASTQYFIDVCNKYNFPYVLMSGTREQRLQTSIKIVDRIMELNAFMRQPI